MYVYGNGYRGRDASENVYDVEVSRSFCLITLNSAFLRIPWFVQIAGGRAPSAVCLYIQGIRKNHCFVTRERIRWGGICICTCTYTHTNIYCIHIYAYVHMDTYACVRSYVYTAATPARALHQVGSMQGGSVKKNVCVQHITHHTRYLYCLSAKTVHIVRVVIFHSFRSYTMRGDKA